MAFVACPIGNPSYGQVMGTRRYQVREKMFSLGDSFRIQDAFGQDVFTVRSKVLSVGDKLILEDIFGNPLIKIRQELLHLHPTYHLLSARPFDSDKELAKIKKKFALLRHRFTIESVYGEYEFDATDIFAREFNLTKKGRIVANVSKKFFALSDTYGVDIAADEDHAFILAMVIVIDQIIYDKDQD